MNRFNEKWVPEPYSGCWLWTGCANEQGYGTFRLGSKIEKAHRAAWKIYRGEIPSGLQICHSCDTPSCVNPDHLFTGTQSDNVRDSFRKGRQHNRGASNPRSKLLDQEVVQIRASGLGSRKLSRRYGVSKTVVQHIRNRKLWAHL